MPTCYNRDGRIGHGLNAAVCLLLAAAALGVSGCTSLFLDKQTQEMLKNLESQRENPKVQMEALEKDPGYIAAQQMTADMPMDAMLYLNQGQVSKAILACEAFLKKDRPPERTVFALAILGSLYSTVGQYDKAVPCLLKARDLGYDSAAAELGGIYLAQGKYEEAIAACVKGLESLKAGQSTAPGILAMMTVVNEFLLRLALAQVYEAGGDSAKAARAYSELVAAIEARMDAALNASQGSLPASAVTLQMAGPNGVGIDPLLYSWSVGGLARVYTATGEYAKAEQLILGAGKNLDRWIGRGLQPFEARMAGSLKTMPSLSAGPSTDPQARANGMVNPIDAMYTMFTTPLWESLARVYREWGQYEKAEAAYNLVWQSYRKQWVEGCQYIALGYSRPDDGPMFGDDQRVRSLFGNLGEIEAITGHWQEALAHQSQSRRAARRYVAATLPCLSDAEQLAYLHAEDKPALHRALSIGLAHGSRPEVAAASAEWWLNGKAVAMESLSERVRLGRESSRTDVRELMKELRAVRSQQAGLTGNNPMSRAGPAMGGRADGRVLAAREQELSRRLGLAGLQDKQADPWVSLSQVQKAIPPDAVLVDLVRLEVYNLQFKGREERWLPARYVAFLVPPSGAAKVIDLGPADAIDAAVTKWRQAMALPAAAPAQAMGGSDPSTADACATRLAELLWQPLKSSLAPAKHLLISPDGALWLFPWEALPDEGGRYLVETRKVSYLTCGRDTLPRASKGRAGTAVVFADPDYELDLASTASAAAGSTRGSQPTQAEEPTEACRSGSPGNPVGPEIVRPDRRILLHRCGSIREPLQGRQEPQGGRSEHARLLRARSGLLERSAAPWRPGQHGSLRASTQCRRRFSHGCP
jgi:tetratricopeptide (TPR) repeat protein